LPITWELLDLPCPEALYESYLRHPSSLAGRFEHDPRDPTWPSHRLAYLARREFDREGLARALEEYNRSLGSAAEVEAGLAALRDPRSVLVIGGQQAGLLTGPLYTVCKAITVLRLARELGRRLAVPVVPCFWVASEDHDTTEVDHAWVLDAEGMPVRLEIDLPRGRRLPVDSIPLAGQGLGVVERLAAVLPPSEHLAEVLILLEETAAAATSVADWFARIMARLFGRRGLVLINPAHPAFRRLTAEAFARILEESPRIVAAVAEGAEAVAALGYHPALRNRPGQAPLFMAGTSGERLPLFLSPGGFAVGSPASGWHLNREEAIALARREPWRFATSVVSRPLVQESVLPVLAQVSGPGEVGYHAQLREAFAGLGLSMPMLWPRLGTTIVDGSVRRLMDRYGVGLEAGPEGLQAALRAKLAELDETGFEAAFNAAREAVKAHYESIERAVTSLDASLGPLTAENLRRVLREIDYLLQRTQAVHADRHRVVVRHFRRMEASLFPCGRQQDRVLNVLPWLARYGANFLGWLADYPFDTDFRHRALLL